MDVVLMQAGTAALTLTLLSDIDSFSSLLLALDTQKSASQPTSQDEVWLHIPL